MKQRDAYTFAVPYTVINGKKVPLTQGLFYKPVDLFEPEPESFIVHAKSFGLLTLPFAAIALVTGAITFGAMCVARNQPKPISITQAQRAVVVHENPLPLVSAETFRTACYGFVKNKTDVFMATKAAKGAKKVFTPTPDIETALKYTMPCPGTSAAPPFAPNQHILKLTAK